MKLISFEKQDNKGEAVVSVERKIFEKELNNTYNYQKKWFNIPGFRKGKVPRSIIENNYGHDIFYDGALQGLYVDLLNFVQNEKNEKIISLKSSPFRRVPSDAMPSVVKVNDDDFEIKVPIYLYPHSYIEFNDMTIEVEKEKKASKTDIENQKKKIFERNSSFELVNDDEYKASVGDMVKVAINDIVFLDKDGKEIEDEDDDDSIESVTVTIGSGRAWKEFENALIGHAKTDGIFSITLTFPEDKRLNIFSGKTVRFGIEISEIKTLTPPSMENLLEKLKLKSEKELNERIEMELNNSNHLSFENSKRKQIDNKLISQISDDMICEVFVKDKVSESMEQLKESLASSNLTVDYYCRAMNTTPEAISSNFYSSAVDSFKLSSALINVSEFLKLSCSDDEVNEYFENFSKAHRISSDLAKKNIPVSQVRSTILCNKSMEHIMNNVVVKEKESSKEESGKAKPKEKKKSPSKKETTTEKKSSTSAKKAKLSSDNQ